MTMIYAGIGSRETPADVLGMMKAIASSMAGKGLILRSGAADGADSAFEKGANRSLREIHLPWNGYNNRYLNQDSCCVVPPVDSRVMAIAKQYHPRWDYLSTAVKNLMCRNVTIVLGLNLDRPVDFVVCWTPNGRLIGGTAHGIKVANGFGIPVYNLANPDHREMLADLYHDL